MDPGRHGRSAGDRGPEDQPYTAIPDAAGGYNGTDVWRFYAPHFGYGADAYATYTMPDGKQMNIAAHDDVTGGDDLLNPNTYPACATPPATVAPGYVCTPGGNIDDQTNFKPVFTFTDAVAAPSLAAGQVCQNTEPLLYCTASNGFTPPPSDTLYELTNFGTTQVSVQDTSTATTQVIGPGQTASFVSGTWTAVGAIIAQVSGGSGSGIALQVVLVAPMPTNQNWTLALIDDLTNQLENLVEGGDPTLVHRRAGRRPPQRVMRALRSRR